MDVNDKLLSFEEYYEYLESSFLDLVRIIPLENHPRTFSPRLYEILHSVCSQIEGVLKLMCDEMALKYTSFPQTYATLNRDGVIVKQKVSLRNRPKWKAIAPFRCNFACLSRIDDDKHDCNQDSAKPKWWGAYNKSKHNLPQGYRIGNVENTYLALASLYVLQHMMKFRSSNMNEFLKQKHWLFTKDYMIHKDAPDSFTQSLPKMPSSMFIPLTAFMTTDR